jgi:hypothetical protein
MNDRCIFMSILLEETKFRRCRAFCQIYFALMPASLACKRRRHSLRKNIAVDASK